MPLTYDKAVVKFNENEYTSVPTAWEHGHNDWPQEINSFCFGRWNVLEQTYQTTKRLKKSKRTDGRVN